MAALIELKEVTREKLKRRLDRLNIAFHNLGFGDAFLAYIDGNPITMDPRKKTRLVHHLNHLSFAFARARAGTLLAGLVDSSTSAATLAAMTEKDRELLVEAFKHQDLVLSNIGFGHILKAALPAIAAIAPTIKKKSSAPTELVIGNTISKDALFEVTPAGTDFNISTLNSTMVSIANGVITGVAAGQARIVGMITSDNSIAVEAGITVKAATPPPAPAALADVPDESVTPAKASRAKK